MFTSKHPHQHRSDKTSVASDPEGVEKLFLELSSETRLAILRELERNNLKTQEIATRVNLTATEAVRQLQRLADAMLIHRNSDGSYTITEYGKTMTKLSMSMEFVFKHKEYFSTHDLWRIPPQFISRIGELSTTKLSMETMENMDRGQRVLSEAEEFAWMVGEGHIPELMLPIMEEKVRKGLKLKILTLESLVVPNTQNVETRGLPLIPVVIVLTEKESLVCFRFIEGRVDYAGFFGKDGKFRDWVRDLFLYYWEKGSRNPISRAD